MGDEGLLRGRLPGIMDARLIGSKVPLEEGCRWSGDGWKESVGTDDSMNRTFQPGYRESDRATGRICGGRRRWQEQYVPKS